MSEDQRLVILVNDRVKMSRGKYAAQAVHAALMARDAHHGGPVIVLGGRPAEIEKCEVQVRDAGHTEVEPGTLTAGVSEVPAVPNDALLATRQMANAANAAIREVVLAALGEEDDGKTPLIDQVRRLAASTVQWGMPDEPGAEVEAVRCECCRTRWERSEDGYWCAPGIRKTWRGLVADHAFGGRRLTDVTKGAEA